MTVSFETMLGFFRKDSRVPLVLTGLFGLLLIFNLLPIIRIFITDESKTVIAASQPISLRPPVDIASLHLFGQYQTHLTDLPQTRLQLTLQGIEFSMVSKESRALISTADQPTQIYKMGDIVPGGATLRTILRDQVILSEHGQLARLNLPVPKLNGMMTAATP